MVNQNLSENSKEEHIASDEKKTKWTWQRICNNVFWGAWKIRKNETTKAQVESSNDANIPVDYLSAKIKDQSLGLNVDL